jgi:hypothetical protein
VLVEKIAEKFLEVLFVNPEVKTFYKLLRLSYQDIYRTTKDRKYLILIKSLIEVGEFVTSYRWLLRDVNPLFQWNSKEHLN